MIDARDPKLLIQVLACVLVLVPSCSSWTKKELCEACQDVSKAFTKGLERTRGSNFGGGNTAWEESRLGTYAFSETRLVGILENICEKDNRQKDACHSLVEEQEETIENWWNKEFREKPLQANLLDFLCIGKLQVCCPSMYFGPQCLPCPAVVRKVKEDNSTGLVACNGHGSCEGEGLRDGKGKCSCDSGYEGDECSMCAENYFSASGNATANATELRCEPCHAACSGGCSGPSPVDCTSSCSEGWEWRAPSDDGAVGGGCVDVDECRNASACDAGKFCRNEEGSHECVDCPIGCANCTGLAPEECTSCATGFRFQDAKNSKGGCEDVNECAQATDDPICGGSKVCVNTSGSFKCECPPGRKEDETGVCVEDVKEETKGEAKEETKEEEKAADSKPGTSDDASETAKEKEEL